ncbi:hypothetical protein BSLG_008479 [Batrachochytrium salamandrivorans]|nr:hypothetical protein BASA83_000834 [Batrachochytrium salamandrivorans]KAJ1332852.1 hypothetical protein BSLG_008479 [Batrachochytrium salamandrivorans]
MGSNVSVIAPSLMIVVATSFIAHGFIKPLFRKGPPGPYPWPIVGNLLSIISYNAKGKLGEYFDGLTNKYGDIYNVKFRPGLDMVLSTDINVGKLILTSPDFSRKSPFIESSSDILNDALFALPSGERWKVHRKFIQPAFGPSHLRHSVVVSLKIVEKVKKIFDLWISNSDTEFVVTDVTGLFSSITLDVIGEVAFTHNFGAVESFSSHENNKSLKYFSDVVSILMRRTLLPWWLWRVSGVSPTSPWVVETRNGTSGIVENVLENRVLEMKENGGDPIRKPLDMDILDRLLVSANDGSQRFSYDEIVGEILGFFLAGHETTSTCLSTVFYETCRDRRVMEKLVAEIDTVYDELHGDINIENISKFKYVDQVIKETLRLHPIVSSLARISVVPVEVQGYQLPAGTHIAMRLRALQRDPRYWDAPLKFNPERFDSQPVPGSYFPFGEGPMTCIGQKLALLEMRLVIIYLLRHFSFQIHDEKDIHVFVTISTKFKNGLKLNVARRDVPSFVGSAIAAI